MLFLFAAIRGIGNWFREWILRYLDGVFFFGFYRGISRESCLYEGNFDNVWLFRNILLFSILFLSGYFPLELNRKITT